MRRTCLRRSGCKSQAFCPFKRGENGRLFPISSLSAARPVAAPQPSRPPPATSSCRLPGPVDRLSLALVCKHMYDATRRNGAALWDSLSLAFGSAAVLRSFGTWCRRCRCHPTRLALLVSRAQGLATGRRAPGWTPYGSRCAALRLAAPAWPVLQAFPPLPSPMARAAPSLPRHAAHRCP